MVSGDGVDGTNGAGAGAWMFEMPELEMRLVTCWFLSLGAVSHGLSCRVIASHRIGYYMALATVVDWSWSLSRCFVNWQYLGWMYTAIIAVTAEYYRQKYKSFFFIYIAAMVTAPFEWFPGRGCKLSRTNL